jgi:hypothetical protein
MLESRSYYFPNENPPLAKGWVVSAKVPYEPMRYPGGMDNPWNYQDYGCAGFRTRRDAENWLDRALETGYVPKEAVVCIMRRN